MNVIKEIQRINEKELQHGLHESGSWHDTYKDSAYVYAGGLPFNMSEGDIIAVFAQYGEVVDVNLVRDKDTGKSKGYAFIAYEDQRSTNLAVDNFNGILIAGRIIRVDHVRQYRGQKTKTEQESESFKLEQSRKEKAILAKHLRTDDDVSDTDDSHNEGDNGQDYNSETEREKRRKAKLDAKLASLDPEDPMRDYLIEKFKKKQEKKHKKKKDKDSKKKHKHH
ncbi:hypothetical protein HK098_004265 [Nowakowskiella sp. JEL0407]|nr:hypothetical protein HK098_004261 [Nowakowskiella sp. JEL0407]KAJ3120756.1 hypothetical protein HK098_004265 [Nowakowskiella sp. JEL0407]